MTEKFLKVVSDFKPAGSQPNAINDLVAGLNDGLLHQTLLGVTGWKNFYYGKSNRANSTTSNCNGT